MLELPADLRPELVPLSWLIGSWEGTGVLDYIAGDTHFTGEFAYRVSFTPVADALRYDAEASLIAPAAGVATDLLAETGFWRVAHAADDADAGPALLPATRARAQRAADDVEAWRAESGGFPIEVALVRADGMSELYVGEVAGPRIELGTDAVVRAPSGKALAASTRMYGLVEQHLLWAWDIAALGAELGSHASARLAKSEG